jgi:branched-chain amino acid transport system permease protein
VRSTRSFDVAGDAVVSVKRSRISARYTVSGAGVLVGLLSCAPWLLSSANVSILQNFLILVIMATMWNLLAGYAGMVSIGQQGFIGLGAYATLYFALKGVNPFVAVPLAILTVAAISVPITYLLLRLRGGYFSVATWVVADSILLLILSFTYLGGGTGAALPGMSNLTPTQLNHDRYFTTWIVALIVVIATYVLLRSRLGLVLSSVRDNEVASRSSGTKVTSTRRMVFIVAAAGCAAAGAVLAISQGFIQPTNEFNLSWTADMLFVTMIGGLGTIEGPILGSVIFIALQQWLQNWGAWYLIIFGAVAVAVAIWQPRGLWGMLRDRFNIELLPVGYRVLDSRRPPETPSRPFAARRRRRAQSRGASTDGDSSDHAAQIP